MSQAQTRFTDVGAIEEVIRSFDFSPGLAVGETLTGPATCEIAVLAGSDPTPTERLLSDASIVGAIVSVMIGNMLDGVTYQVRADVSTSAGQLLSLWSIQKCVGP